MSEKILHCIGALHKGGGAEEVLYQLVSNDRQSTHVVISLQGNGFYGERLQAQGITVETIGLSSSPLSLFKLVKLFRLIRAEKPDVIQTWLYYSDFIGGIVGRMAGVKNVVWGIHHTTHDQSKSSLAIRATHKMCACISSIVPKEIISCSDAGLVSHVDAGYAKDKMHVVHNGYDLEGFSPDVSPLEDVRHKYELDDGFLIAMFGRWDPQKDHESLLVALSRFKTKVTIPWSCLLFGTNINSNNQELADLIAKFDLQENIVLGGLVDNVAGIMVQLDLKVLSSRFGEAFPNVLNEAMACSIPCATTDVGDAAKIVGNCGWVSPPGVPMALADNIQLAMQEYAEDRPSWLVRKQDCRQRIVENFTVVSMIEQYHKVWQKP